MRPPPRRLWNGPLIGREAEDADEYIARVTALLSDSHTHVYFDASFLMWLAKTGAPARDEFFRWQAAHGETRFHVPLWAAHEFFKHRLKNTVSDELKKEIKTFDGAATGLYEKLRIYCSDQLFGFKDSGRLFLDEYRRTVQPLRAMLKLAEKSEQFENAVQEVALYIDEHLLSGPLEGVIDGIELDERVRNRGVIPPAFKDAHKRSGRRAENGKEEPENSGDNSFGDLALWREVLRHASEVRAGATILLTGDRKNDWFENRHAEEGITVAIRKRVSKPRPVPAPHPLLLREAFDRGAGELVLLDPMYCGVLLEQGGLGSTNFSAAAHQAYLPEPERKRLALSWARRFGKEALLVGESFAPGQEDEIEEAPFDAGSLDIDQLKPSADFPAEVVTSLTALGEGDVVARGQVLASLDTDALSTWGTPALVSLGRAISRLAEREDLAAIERLSWLRDHAPDLPAAVREPLYFGALGALYFDDNLDVRPSRGSQVSTILLGLVTAGEVSGATEVLDAALAEQKLLYRPGQPGPLLLQITVQPSANGKSPADLVAIKLRGTDLMTGLQDVEGLRFTSLLGLPAGEADIKLGELIEIVARYHRLPRQFLEADTNLDTPVRVPEYAGVDLDI